MTLRMNPQSPSVSQSYNPKANAYGAFPSVTTFAGEQRVLTVGREALVSVKRAGGAMGRMLVAVDRMGYRTDYPMAYDNGQVVYDRPEMFSKRFKERARRHVLSFYGKE